MKTVIANFKMNLGLNSTKEYFQSFMTKKYLKTVKVGFALPYTCLSEIISDTENAGFLIGAQNVCEEGKGAFTGEISAEMLKELGVKFALVGHSERRQYFGDTNDKVNKKIKKLMPCALKVVLCIGECKEDRTTGKTKNVLKKQLEEATNGLFENEMKNIILAYEPVWSIGTGNVPTEKQIVSTVAFIRSVIANLFSEKCAKEIGILYGGSINENNAKKVLNYEGVDGGLVGGASLNPIEFANIINSCKVEKK